MGNKQDSKSKANRKAQQKWASNPENKKKKALYRLIKRIKNDEKISVETLDNYSITEERFNEFRKEEGLEPLKLFYPNLLSTEATIQKANRDKATEKAIEAEIKMAQSVKEKSVALQNVLGPYDTKSTPMQGRSEKIDLLETDKQSLNFNDIRNFFHKRLDIKGSPETFSGYFGESSTDRKGSFWRAVKFAGCDTETNLIPCFKNAEHWIEKIEEESVKQNYSVGTTKKYFQVLLVVLDQYPQMIEKFNLGESYKLFEEKFNKLKAKEQTKRIKSKKVDIVTPFDTIKEMVFKEFGDGRGEKDPRQETIFMHLYEEFPSRDDFGDLFVVENEDQLEIKEGQSQFKDQNYIWIKTKPKDKNHKRYKNAEIILQVYKTSNLYKTIRQELSGQLTTLIRNSLAARPREFLFIKQSQFILLKPDSDPVGELALYNVVEKDGVKTKDKPSLSSFVGNMLQKAGIKKGTTEDGGKINAGTINLLRHALISQKFADNPDMSEVERETLAKQFRHSPVTTEDYIRKLHIDKIGDKQLDLENDSNTKIIPDRSIEPKKKEAKPKATPKPKPKPEPKKKAPEKKKKEEPKKIGLPVGTPYEEQFKVTGKRERKKPKR